MNWDQIEGRWKQYAGKVKEKWSKLTDSDLELIRGKREQLIGKIQENYGIAREEAQRQVDEFARTFYSNEQEERTGTAKREEKETTREKTRRVGQT
jgi:uncharacterized protein YjbJ (UPF0337 family)